MKKHHADRKAGQTVGFVCRATTRVDSLRVVTSSKTILILMLKAMGRIPRTGMYLRIIVIV